MKAKILSFDALRRYSREYGHDAVRTAARFWARSRAKEHTPTLWERIYPRAEVRRLRAFVEAMRAEEQLAAKNALGLYAENESLRRYRDYYQGRSSLVDYNTYNKAREDCAKWRDKFDTVSRALNQQHSEWTEYMKNQPAPKKK